MWYGAFDRARFQLHSSSKQSVQLNKTLGPIDLTLLGVGSSIGAGIFVFTGTEANKTGSSVVLAFGIAGLICAWNALCFSELSCLFPESGSVYLYAYYGFGRLCAAVVGVNLLIDYHVGTASIARALVNYGMHLAQKAGWDNIPSWVLGKNGEDTSFISISVLAPVVLLLLTLLLSKGMKESSCINNMLTGLKIAIVLLVIVAGATKADSANYAPFLADGPSALFKAAGTLFFAYIGFDAVCNTAEECKRPQRDLPLGILMSLLICAVLYGGVSLVLCGLVPAADRATPSFKDHPLDVGFELVGMNWVQIVIDIGAICGLSTTLLVGLYSQARVYVAIARDGLLPSRFAQVSRQYHTPVAAQTFCCAVASVLALLLNVEKLSELLSIGLLLAYTVACSAVLVLRMDAAQAVYLRQSSSGTLLNVLPGNRRYSCWYRGLRPRRLLCSLLAALACASMLPGLGLRLQWDGWQTALACLPALMLMLGVYLMFPFHPVDESMAITPSVAREADRPFSFSAADKCEQEGVLGQKKRKNKRQGGGSAAAQFRTPLVPLIPMLGVCFNCFVAVQRPLAGWVRLGSVTLLVVVGFAVSNCWSGDGGAFSKCKAQDSSTSQNASRDTSVWATPKRALPRSSASDVENESQPLLGAVVL